MSFEGDPEGVHGMGGLGRGGVSAQTGNHVPLFHLVTRSK